MITLKEIDRDNFSAVLGLSTGEDQKGLVASNMYSLAQAKAQPECVPLAVYAGREPVGFVMYCMDATDGEYWIYRVMIDARHQQKGYGRAAMLAMLDVIRRDAGHNKVYISFEPRNEVAKKLYESMGFVPDGRIEGGETVYRLDY